MGIVVVNHVTLDGVMQGPGRPDEDDRDGFTHGGWALDISDPVLSAAMGAVMGGGFSWLLGHRTYDDLLSHWNDVGGAFRDGLNATTKYVVSTDADADLAWPNSRLVTGDVPAEIAGLRAAQPGNLVVMGSGELIRSTLLPHDLVDELLLLVDPVAVGGGTRLFPDDDALRRFDLLSAEAAQGLAVLRYRVARGD